jgi:Protein of unknown function (DUF1501)
VRGSQQLMNTGIMNAGRPCLGSWLSYGLGSMNDNLPNFIVLQPKVNPKGSGCVSPYVVPCTHVSRECSYPTVERSDAGLST